jgi:nitroreductase
MSTAHAPAPSTPRQAAAPILPLFLERWSPRSFTDEPLPREALLHILEAARWSPSANNAQPWRFVYAMRGDAAWDVLLSLPNERNQGWCKRAGALLLIVSDTGSRTASFDAGCAWGYLALQAAHLGWATHAMAGFDAVKARQLLNVPEQLAAQAMVAIGRRGPADQLPEGLREREGPSARRPLAESIVHGAFPKDGA